KWQAELDMSSMIDELLSGSGVTFDTSFAKLTLEIEYKADGSAEKSVTTESLESFVNGYIDAMIKMLEDMGMSYEDAFGDITEEEARKAAIEEFSKQMPEGDAGYYKLDGNKLYDGKDKEELEENIKDGNYTEIKLDGNTMTFISINGDIADSTAMEMVKDLLPVTFTRIG
ncbi:MAG: hypothetical protein PUA85_03605, partial [Oscillospiraceae bacterium]|nr:hypothetical protein [Oscillospiraceae bacterium]